MPSRTYPSGATCWIDTEQSDPEAAGDFYGRLFGWTFENAMPPDAPESYLIAKLDGEDVAAIGTGSGPPSWNTYIAVEDADAAAATVREAGGSIASGPTDAGPGGRTVACLDRDGAPFRLLQAHRRLGAQIANVPGAWNFSDLRTPDPVVAQQFYSTLFGWVVEPGGETGGLIHVPGYGRHLAATTDPGIFERQKDAPAGFADVIGGIERTDDGLPSQWQVKISVADRDDSAALVERLGGVVVSTSEDDWVALALIRDPQGAEFSISEFRPPV